jgi:hypothetical protein
MEGGGVRKPNRRGPPLAVRGRSSGGVRAVTKPTRLSKFEDLARRLLAVPKAQVDEAREKAKRDSTRKSRRPS